MFDRKKYDREYRKNNPVKNREKQKRYREKNREKVRERKKRWIENNPEYKRQYYIKNREKILKQNRQYRKNNPEKAKEKYKKYRENHHEERKKYAKEYNKNHFQSEYDKQKRRDYDKRYYQTHKEIKNKYNRKRYKTNPKIRINDRMSRAIYNSLKGNKKCKHWESLVDYNVNDLIKHLKKTIPKGYTWQDYMEGRLNIDHKIPIRVFNFTGLGHPDFKRCWALKNLRLIPPKENFIKGSKIRKPFQPALKINLTSIFIYDIFVTKEINQWKRLF